jgi:hypothetical protein
MMDGVHKLITSVLKPMAEHTEDARASEKLHRLPVGLPDFLQRTNGFSLTNDVFFRSKSLYTRAYWQTFAYAFSNVGLGSLTIRSNPTPYLNSS